MTHYLHSIQVFLTFSTNVRLLLQAFNFVFDVFVGFFVNKIFDAFKIDMFISQTIERFSFVRFDF